jgi:hypothetical protein
MSRSYEPEHGRRCGCPACLERYPEHRAWSALFGAGNAVAYLVFGLIGLVVLYLLITWGYHEWWISQHCTMVLGTQVCR